MLDFIVSGRVSWQEERLASDALQERCDGNDRMKRCVVKDYDIAYFKLGYKRFFHPLRKEITITVSSKDDGCE